MFGKHFSSMYDGSMIGAGAVAFAVMGYVISHMKPDASVGMQVELNPKLLSFVIGESEELIDGAIKFLCAPDKASRTPDEEGRRLIQLGPFSYRVVNGLKYDSIKNEEDRRRQNREAQARFRKRMALRAQGMPLAGEVEYDMALKRGDPQEVLDEIVTRNLKRKTKKD